MKHLFLFWSSFVIVRKVSEFAVVIVEFVIVVAKSLLKSSIFSILLLEIENFVTTL